MGVAQEAPLLIQSGRIKAPPKFVEVVLGTLVRWHVGQDVDTSLTRRLGVVI
jgi:hypothetical protein